jgi:hemerythrin
MNLKQTGLGRRMQIEGRRISDQHRQLDQLFGLVAAALEGDDAAAARAAFQRFRDALEAHFSMEDDVHFPALHGLRPALEPELTALVEEHRHFRTELEALAAQLTSGALAEAADAVDRFVTGLATHEGREEKLLAALLAERNG